MAIKKASGGNGGSRPKKAAQSPVFDQRSEDVIRVDLTANSSGPAFASDHPQKKRGRPNLPLEQIGLEHPGRGKQKRANAPDGHIEQHSITPDEHNDADQQASKSKTVPHDEYGVPLVVSSVISIPARARFLLALSNWPSLKDAARAAGYHLTAFHRLRRIDPAFAEQWDEAAASGRAEWEHRAQVRAFKGVRGRPIFNAGKLVGYERVYSDKLAELMLAAHDEKYSPRVRHSGTVAHAHMHQHTLAPELEDLLRDVAGPERKPPPSRAAVIEARAIAESSGAGAPSMVDEALEAIAAAEQTQDVVKSGDE